MSLFPANGSPQIKVQTVFNVTVGEESSLTVNVTDPDGDVVSMTLRTDLPNGATFDNVTGVFTWTPSDTTPVNITYEYIHCLTKCLKVYFIMFDEMHGQLGEAM